MGLLANLPVGLAPGLGLNAYVCFIWAFPFQARAVITVLTVCILRRRISRLWSDYLPRCTFGSIPRGVRI